MSQQRMAIMDKIRTAHRARGIGSSQQAVDARLNARAQNLVPARGRLTGAVLRALFEQFAVKSQASIVSVAAPRDVPQAIGAYLTAHHLPGPARLSGDAWLCAMPWDAIARFNPATGAVQETDGVGVSVALCAIGETGTLMLISGPNAASGLNFLPPAHIIVLRAGDIVGALEDGWARLRQAGNGQMPRTVNLITGPSRTADIAQTMYMGAHGPKHLHVIIVDNHA